MYKHARNYHTFTQKRFILVYPDNVHRCRFTLSRPEGQRRGRPVAALGSSLSSLGSSEVAFKNVALFGAL